VIRDSHARVNFVAGVDRLLFSDPKIGIAVTATACRSSRKAGRCAGTAHRLVGLVDELADITCRSAILNAELCLPVPAAFPTFRDCVWHAPTPPRAGRRYVYRISLRLPQARGKAATRCVLPAP
jgi:hypothetical protein